MFFECFMLRTAQIYDLILWGVITLRFDHFWHPINDQLYVTGRVKNDHLWEMENDYP